MKNRLLNIHMNGIHIARLEKSARGALRFTYEPTWLEKPGARPISLSLPLVDKSLSSDIVYNFFDNLLPDSPLIRGRIQTKFNIPTNHPFDLLASIGKDCVGAIQIVEDEAVIHSKTIKFETLSDKSIAAILRGYQNSPLGMTNDFKDFRISIAGAQEKAAFLYHKKKWTVPLEETPTTHIFKLPIGMIQHQQLDLRDSCENEWLCAQVAQAFGFEVAKCDIKNFQDVKVLVVERFDRKLSSDKKWIMRLPQEDMCQALGLSSRLKYQSDGGPGIKEIMQLLIGSENSVHSRDTFFRTQILFWLLCAIDGHAKNFSIFIEPEGRYRLTPLYDIISAFPLTAARQLEAKKVKMAMALKGANVHYRWFEVQRSHFIETAQKVGYSAIRADALVEEMLGQMDMVIDTITKKMPHDFPERIAQPIFDGMRLMRNRLSKK